MHRQPEADRPGPAQLYESALGTFPPAAQGGYASVYLDYTGYSFLLPYLEQGSAFNVFNFSPTSGGAIPIQGWSQPGNSTAFTLQSGVFLCPSNRATGEVGATSGDGWSVPKAAVTDYLFNDGASRYAIRGYGEAARMGPFGFDTATRLAEIADGTGNTILMGEAAGGNSRNRAYASGAGAGRVCLPLASYSPAVPVYYDNLMFMAYGRSRTWARGSVTARIIGGLVARTVDSTGAPYRPNDCGAESVTDVFDPAPGPPAPAGQKLPNFRSTHPGVTNFLFGDGTVRAIKDSISVDTYQSLSTIAGGEITPSDGY